MFCLIAPLYAAFGVNGHQSEPLAPGCQSDGDFMVLRCETVRRTTLWEPAATAPEEYAPITCKFIHKNVV